MTRACPYCGGPVGDCVVVPMHCRTKPKPKAKATSELRLATRDLPERILTALYEHGPLTANQIVGTVERRRKTVLQAVRELHQTNRIVKSQEGRWTAIDGANGDGDSRGEPEAARYARPVVLGARETGNARNAGAGS